MNSPYVIYAVPYAHNSAGIRAYHRLCHELNEAGERCYTINAGNPEWNEPLLSSVGGWNVLSGENPIAIYDTIVIKNPLQANRIARWVLLHPGGLGEPPYVPYDFEETFSWSHDFYDVPDDRILKVDVLDRGLFFCDGNEVRTHDTVYYGKGRKETCGDTAVASPVDTSGMITMVSGWPPTREGVASLLRETATLYTYDSITMVADEALLCGCKVVLLPENKEIPHTVMEDSDYGGMLDSFIEKTQNGKISA
jgi:hypothetical protein